MAAPRKKPTRHERIQQEVYKEWLGCDTPTPSNRNVSAAADWIAAILKKQFFADNLDEEKVMAAWKEIAGNFIASQTKPESIKNGTLTLLVTQPSMRFHLEQMKPELLRNIQARFGSDKITSIRFNLG